MEEAFSRGDCQHGADCINSQHQSDSSGSREI